MIGKIAASLALALMAVFLTVDIAQAQCPMCVRALEQNSGELAAGFNRGILFLLSMPYLVVTAVGAFWYRNRRKRASQPASSK